MTAKLAYSIASAALAVDLSDRTIRGAIADGSLTAHYSGTKAVIDADDLREWLASLPTRRAS